MEAINSGVLSKFGKADEPFVTDSLMGQLLYNIAKDGIIVKLRESATKKGVVATKALRSSMRPTLPAVTSRDVKVSVTGEEHWIWAEEGRRKGKFPPIKAIEEWITAKGIQVRKSRTQSTKSVLAARKSMAFAIARSIAKKGTIKRFGHKGSGFVKDVINSRQMKLMAEYFAEQTGKQLLIYVSNGSPKP